LAIYIDNDYDVKFEKPIDRLSRNPLDFTNDGSTASFKVFNNDKLTQVVSGADAVNTIVVSDASNIQIGDVIEVRLADKTMWTIGTVTDVDTDTDTLTMTFANPEDLLPGPLRVRLGAQVALAEYGDAKVGANDYGFFGVMPWDHPGLAVGMEIEILMTFTGSPPSGLRVTRRIVDTVLDNLIDVD